MLEMSCIGPDGMSICQAPDLDLARIFYSDGLSFTEDPGTWSKQRGGFGVLWFNLGRHQMHVVKKAPAQRTAGCITAVVQDLKLVKSHLSELTDPLKGTHFRCCMPAGNLAACTCNRHAWNTQETVVTCAATRQQETRCM